MVYFAIITLTFSLIFLFSGTDESRKVSYRRVGRSGIAFAGLLFVFSFMTTIAAGHVGVKSLFGKVYADYLPEGLHFVNPFVSVRERSIQTLAYSMAGEHSISVLSSDGLMMPLDVTVNYRLVPSDAPWAFQNLGKSISDKIILPPTRSAVREASAAFTSQELYSTKRSEAADKMQSLLREKIDVILNEYGYKGQVVSVQQVLIRNVGLPNKVRLAIEQKLEAEQRSQQMEFTLQIERQEAQRKEIEAAGIARFQAIVREGIDEKLLRWKGIEATRELAESENTKVVIFGSNETGGLPVILQPSK